MRATLVARLEIVWLAAALLLGVAAEAAPRTSRYVAAPLEREVILRGTNSAGDVLMLRVPVNLFPQLQQPGSGSNINLNQIGGTSVSSSLYDSGNTALKVNCVIGCSASAGFTDNSAFTAGTTTETNIGGVFNDGLTALASGNAGAIRATSDRMLYVNLGKMGGTAVPAGLVDTGNNAFKVNCVTGCSASAGFTDNSAFTAGTTTETNIGGVFNDGLTALASGNAAAARLTPNRGLHVNLRNNSGTEIATSSNPLRVDPIGTTTQPVSGTVTANQGGTWTVQPGNTANTTAWLMNVGQFGGTNVVTGTGASGAGIPRVTVSNDSNILATQSGTWTVQPGNTANTTAWLVTGTGGTFPATQSGTWTVQPGNTANTTAWLVTGTGGTFPATQSGTWTVQPGNTANTTPWLVQGNLANNGVAAATNRVATLPGIAQTSYVNGTAYTQGRDAAPDVFTDGALHVAAMPAMRPASYRASSQFAGSSTTDVAVLPGNASNTVLVTRVSVSCTQTTAGTVNLSVIKRSAADTSGTSASMTVVPMDSNYAAGSSAPLSYTGTGPTVGAAVGDVDDYKLGCIATGTATPNDIYIGNFRQKPIVLRGTAQQLAVNFGGAITGGNLTVTFEWIETATITP